MASSAKIKYAELHCISNFSFLTGASHPEELVQEAAKQNYQALAITDECSLAGVVRAHVEAQKHDITLLIGSQFHTQEGLHLIAGVDEAGRGPLAGDVVAAAVILPADCTIAGLTDSKKLSPKQREKLCSSTVGNLCRS